MAPETLGFALIASGVWGALTVVALTLVHAHGELNQEVDA